MINATTGLFTNQTMLYDAGFAAGSGSSQGGVGDPVTFGATSDRYVERDSSGNFVREWFRRSDGSYD